MGKGELSHLGTVEKGQFVLQKSPEAEVFIQLRPMNSHRTDFIIFKLWQGC